MRHSELYRADQHSYTYYDTLGQLQIISLPANSLAFTICQIPVIYTSGDTAMLEVIYSDDRVETIAETSLGKTASRHMMARDGGAFAF